MALSHDRRTLALEQEQRDLCRFWETQSYNEKRVIHDQWALALIAAGLIAAPDPANPQRPFESLRVSGLSAALYAFRDEVFSVDWRKQYGRQANVLFLAVLRSHRG
jgi:hypothetical protein